MENERKLDKPSSGARQSRMDALVRHSAKEGPSVMLCRNNVVLIKRRNHRPLSEGSTIKTNRCAFKTLPIKLD